VLNGSRERLAGDANQRFQEWAFSGQLDLPLGSIVEGRTFVFTLSGRASNRPLPPGNERDTIWLGQAKLTFPIKDGGVKIPLSVTAASRTDLIDESVVRANVGLTLNLDSLVSR
jgi:hypothetical protein